MDLHNINYIYYYYFYTILFYVFFYNNAVRNNNFTQTHMKSAMFICVRLSQERFTKLVQMSSGTYLMDSCFAQSRSR